jgi:hypothetical protein
MWLMLLNMVGVLQGRRRALPHLQALCGAVPATSVRWRTVGAQRQPHDRRTCLAAPKEPMQITVQSSLQAAGSSPLTDHVQGLVRQALARFGERVSRVEAHLSDADGTARSGNDGIQCTLEAHLIGLDPVVVTSRAGNTHVAIADAVHTLKRAVGTAIARHDPRNRRAAPPGGEATQLELI